MTHADDKPVVAQRPRGQDRRPPLVNDTEIRVVGMSRSGNHAIIEWLLSQADGRVCFLNCAEARTNPFWSARPLGPGWDTPAHRVSYDDFCLDAERRGELGRKHLLVHSYEDTFLTALSDARQPHDPARHVGRSGRRVDALVLRDPLNLFASRRASGVGYMEPQTAVRLWIQHAREFLGERHHLRPGRIAISYNRWVASAGYRRAIAERLGLRCDDGALRSVASCAGGSSFDGLDYDGRADQMAVLDRWRSYADDPGFRRLLSPLVLELSARIFGPPAREQPGRAAA